MFCSSCGKQLADGVKFCRYCGASTGTPVAQNHPSSASNRYNEATNNTYSNAQIHQQQSFNSPAYGGAGSAMDTGQIGILIAMIAITVYVAIGWFRPIAAVGAFGYEEEFSIKNLSEIVKILERFESEDSGYQTVKYVIGCSSLISLLSALFGGLFLFNLLCGKKGKSLTEWARGCMWCQLIAVVIVALLMVYFNKELEGYSYGVDLFKVTVEGWVLLILPWFNLYGAIRSYENKI